jgi:PAS domain-containing protein
MQPSEYGESSRPTHEILRESEERFRLLVEGVKDYAIFMLDADGYITTWNIGAQRIKGYESEEIIGSTSRSSTPMRTSSADIPMRSCASRPPMAATRKRE